MLYAILCYNSQAAVAAWTPEEDAAVMARLGQVHDRLLAEGKLSHAARLRPTTTAQTLMKGDRPMILDGPYAETKEQMLGFYVVDCADQAEALAIAGDLAVANPGLGGYEVRPIQLFIPERGAG